METSARQIGTSSPALGRSPRRDGGQGAERSYTARIFHLTAALIAVAALYWAKEILLPFALAVLVSFLLNPVVTLLDRLGRGRIFSVSVAVLAMGLAVFAIGWLVTSQLMDLGTELPRYRGVLLERVRSLSGKTDTGLQEAADTIEELGAELTGTNEDADSDDESENAADQEPDPQELIRGGLIGPTLPRPPLRADARRRGSNEEAVAVRVVALPPSPLKQIRDWLGPLLSPLATFSLVVVLVIFMLLKREDLRYRLIQLFGTSHMRVTTEALNDAAARVGRFLRMQLLINSCYGGAVGIGLYLIGVPNALLWGVMGLLLRFLPYVGPWLAAVMPLTISLAVFDGWNYPLMVAGMFIVLELTVNMLLEPWLYGASIGVSSLGIIIAAIFWTWLWGGVGLVLAMPLTVCLVVAAQHVPQLRFVSILLGDQVSLSLGERIYQRLLALDEDEAHSLALTSLKNESLAEVYDVGLVPALYLAEADRHAGLLSEQQQAFIFQALRDLIEDCAHEAEESAAVATEKNGESPRKVFCIPVRDEADQIASLMLQLLLEREGMEVEMGSLQSTAGETVEAVEQHQPHAVVLSVLPPLGARDGRYLCKRLRARYTNLPILAGLWSSSGMEQSASRLTTAGANDVVTSFKSAMRILGPARQPKVVEEAALS